MYKIVRKKELNPSVTLMEVEAPFIAKKAKAGQFIIFRVDEMGERVDRKSTRLNSSHPPESRMPSSA